MLDEERLDRMSWQPRDGSGLAHDPLAAILGPRPVGWISTCDASGCPNLAPYSFFNIFNYRPPIVAFASVGLKDTARNARETGEFVVNLATRELADAMNATSAEVAPSVDEFDLAGLAKRPSMQVRPPAVAQSPVALECRVTKVAPLTDSAGHVLDTWMVFGEVVHVHVVRRLLAGGGYDTAGARPILRGGGPADYFEIAPQALFRMRRP